LTINIKPGTAGFVVTDKLLAAISSRNFTNPATQADINKDPKLKATDCYRITKGFENAQA
jgi:hypothetical protein